MDYLMAYIAWDLDLVDLKQLVHNSLDFASIDEDHRKEVLNFATRKWIKFLRFVRGRH
jgi:adenosine deaminase